VEILPALRDFATVCQASLMFFFFFTGRPASTLVRGSHLLHVQLLDGQQLLHGLEGLRGRASLTPPHSLTFILDSPDEGNPTAQVQAA